MTSHTENNVLSFSFWESVGFHHCVVLVMQDGVATLVIHPISLLLLLFLSLSLFIFLGIYYSLFPLLLIVAFVSYQHLEIQQCACNVIKSLY